jgi:hypothetical protein
MEVGHYNIAQAQSTSTKAIFFSANQVSYRFAPQTKAIIFSANRVSIVSRLKQKRYFFSQSVCASNESDNFFSQSGVLLLRCL